MTRSRLVRMTRAVAMLAIGSAATAQAQNATADTAQTRNACRFAIQVLETGQPATHRLEALATIGRCGAEGAAVLATVWSSPVASREELIALVMASRSVASDEIVRGLVTAAGRRDLPTSQRVGVIAVLMTYANPSLVPSVDDLATVDQRAKRRSIGPASQPFVTMGRESLGVPVAETLARLLDALRSDPDATIQHAVGVAARSLYTPL